MSVIFAGPRDEDLLFAILLLAIVLMVGVRVATLTVGEVSPGSPTDIGGLGEGRRIYAVNGMRVTEFDELTTRCRTAKVDRSIYL